MLSVQSARRPAASLPPRPAEQSARFQEPAHTSGAIPQPPVGVASAPCTLPYYFSLVSRSLGPGDVDIERLQDRTHSADDFARPESLAEDRNPAFGGFADGAARVGGFVGIQAASGKLAFEGGVGFGRRSGAQAEGFGLKACDELLENLDGRLRDNQAAPGGLAESDMLRDAKVAHPVEMAEEIDGVALLGGQGREKRRPDASGVPAGERLATFRFDELKPDGLGSGP